MRRKTFMTLLGLALMVPLSSCETFPKDSVSNEENESSSSSFSIPSSDPYDIPHGKPTLDKLNFAEDKEGKGVFVKAASRGISGEVVIPTSYGRYSVTGISVRGFQDCEGITSVYIPKSVKIIGSEAFRNCPNLESVFISETVSTLGEYIVFSSCPKLRITVSERNPYFSSLDGALYNKDKTEIIWAPSDVTSISLPDTVKTIGNYAYSNSKLTSINIPLGVKTIGPGAFSQCSSASSSLSIPDTVETIGDQAFYKIVRTSPMSISETISKQSAPLLSSIVIPSQASSFLIASPQLAGRPSLAVITSPR